MLNITAKTKINLIIGDPVKHSLSPQMHNAGYNALGIDDEFVFVAAEVSPSSLEDFVRGSRAGRFNGMCITIPHKVEIMKFLDEIHPDAKIIGAVNTVVNIDGKLIGYNTDWLGVKRPLRKVTAVHGKKVAIIGAGGAARAMCFAIQVDGGKITIYNRTLAHAQTLAREFGGEAKPLESISEVTTADIILNATSVGLNEQSSLISKEFLHNGQVVFDAVYKPWETKLLKDAKTKGAQIIHGTEMLLYQGAEQFRRFTNHEAPIQAMSDALLEYLQEDVYEA